MPSLKNSKKTSRRSPTKKKVVTKKKSVASRRVRAKKVLTISKEPVFNPFARTGLLIIIVLLTAVYLLIPNYGTSIANANPNWVKLASRYGCPINKVFGIPPTVAEKHNGHPKCTKMMKQILLDNAPSRITKNFKGKSPKGEFGPGVTTAVKLVKADFHDANVYGQYDGIVDPRMWQIIRFIYENGYSPNSDRAPTGPSGAAAVWPFPTKSPSQYRRIDQGWDLQGDSGVAVLAVGSGTVHVYKPDPGGFGNDYPVLELDTSIGGPSNFIYYGHAHILGGFNGKHVHTGQVIGYTSTQSGQNGSDSSPGWLEIGFAKPGTDAPFIHGGEGSATSAGQAIHDILINAPRY